jgi:hypothetical protein
MKSIDLADRPRGSARAAAQLAQKQRRIRRRPRTAEERELIIRMALVEVARRHAEGRLVRLGPRAYEMHPRQV